MSVCVSKSSFMGVGAVAEWFVTLLWMKKRSVDPEPLWKRPGGASWPSDCGCVPSRSLVDRIRACLYEGKEGAH